VKSFEEKHLIAEFQTIDWSQCEIPEAHRFLRVLKASATTEPGGIRAQPWPQTRDWEQRYPLWFVPFTAGLLFVSLETWESVLAQYDEPVPGRMKKEWIQQVALCG
jgi:hypothetical protein